MEAQVAGYDGPAAGPRPRAFARVTESFPLTLLAVDIGGTFTDLVGFDPADNRFFHAKSLTTPDDFSEGIVDCIRQSGLDVGAVGLLIHGTTVAINTLIERTGAKTALLVTRGTRDVYIIGRGNRPEAYNLFFHRPPPAGLAPPDPGDRRAHEGRRRGAHAPRFRRGRSPRRDSCRGGYRGGRGLPASLLRQSGP